MHQLMPSSSFFALSADLCIQIQYIKATNDSIINNKAILLPTITCNNNTSEEIILNSKQKSKESVMENVNKEATNTLVVSKYFNPQLEEFKNANFINSKNYELFKQRNDMEIVKNMHFFSNYINLTQITVPCQIFLMAGLYEIKIVLGSSKIDISLESSSNKTEEVESIKSNTFQPIREQILMQIINVQWPRVEMIVSPIRLKTYPENPVRVILKFIDLNCNQALENEKLPEFWLELVYCGRNSSCSQMKLQNISKTNILYEEQVHGYPKLKSLTLDCSLFGLAGNYVLQLRPMASAYDISIVRRFITVEWSDKFVFNVHTSSIFPCDPHIGIGVLYQYPRCILDQGDRVRLYAKLRADVVSLKPPTSLHYIYEKRVVKGQHAIYFSCDLFTEKYIEYCFKYVTQSISGAVADVRVDCVSTLPVKDSDTGGWGPWSDWTPCSTNCFGGTRNRYRFCDSPPPRYGAKFCEGTSVQTETCNNNTSQTWNCIYEGGIELNAIKLTQNLQETGLKCRCGCIIHLTSSKQSRIITATTQTCPGKSFWLIQADDVENIKLNLQYLHLSCSTQYIKVRNGPSLSSNLLAEYNSGNSIKVLKEINSSKAQMLIEFNSGLDFESSTKFEGMIKKSNSSKYTLCSGGFLATIQQLNTKNQTSKLFTNINSITKNRALQISKTNLTVVHLSAFVFAGIIIILSAILAAHYLVKYHKYNIAIKQHREDDSQLHSLYSSTNYLPYPVIRAISATTLLSEVVSFVKIRPKNKPRRLILQENLEATTISEGDLNDPILESEVINSRSDVHTTESKNVISKSLSDNKVDKTDECCTYAGTLDKKFSRKSNESSIYSGLNYILNNSSAEIKRQIKHSDFYDAVTYNMQNSKNLYDPQRSSSVNNCSIFVQPDASGGFYSPASILSTATIRTTNLKESKDKHNLKKLLGRPGSEFSLETQEDLEFDYYDYNVINAAAAPGSYLGMDPAYLIWVPPCNDFVDVDDSDNKTKILPQRFAIEKECTYKKTQFPEFEQLISSATKTNYSDNKVNDLVKNNSMGTAQEENVKNSINFKRSLTKFTTTFGKEEQIQLKKQSVSMVSINQNEDIVPLHVFRATNSARNLLAVDEIFEDLTTMCDSYIEKETSVEKSHISDLHNVLSLDDIHFADDSENEINQ
ncbi:uncharacterized protein LOC119672981 [Teleopsis dalmanni]|uniref:uncharacterized protein LOC119672981 n=1 Tax=Teleopsis dalmanni TaxID=139649 RepID=UPI0018CF4FF2|nr:uncharacterized protein LOC119672981 [Teleopsis dalmanni]